MENFLTKKKRLRVLCRAISLFLFCSIFSSNLSAQETIEVSGKVTDSNSGETLVGVNILLQGSTQGTITNLDGEFLLDNIPADGILIASFVGYESATIEVANRTAIDIQLKENTVGVDEVVVVGYGTTKKSNLTGAVSVVKTDDLMKAQVANVSNAVVGRMPGIIAKQASGEPGKDGSQLFIRGVATFQGNTTPAVIIDGVERSYEDFSQIDPNEIESVNVLKDAAAASIFGMSGANGVILVTTKRGKSGKPQVSYSYNLGVQSPTKLPEFVNSADYAILSNERNTYLGQEPAYTDIEISAFRNGTDRDNYPNTDWYDVIMENDNAIQQQHNLSINGGSEKLRYFTSVGYLDQGGFYDALNFKRFNLRSNIDIDLSKYTTVSVNVSGRVEKTEEAATPSNGIFAETLRNPSIMSATYSNGGIAAPLGGHQNTYGAVKEGGYGKTTNNTILTTLELNQKIPWVEGLSVKGVMSYDKNYFNNKVWSLDPQEYSLGTGGEFIKMPKSAPSLTLNQNEFDNLELQLQLNYNKTFGEHSITALAMFLQRERNTSVSTINAWGYSSETLAEITAASEQSSIGNAQEFGRQSYIGRLNYTYGGKYMVEGNMRRDGTENFHPDKRWGTFASFSLGWVVSEEAFFKDNISFINFLKVRGSYGTLGNDQINGDRFAYYGKYNISSPFNWLGSTMNYGSYYFGGAYVVGLEPGAIKNKNITWEKSKKTNFALDAQILDKLDITFDYFIEKRTDILTQRSASVPLTFGATLPMENIGEVENKGFEISLAYNQKIGDLHFYLGGNFTYAKNEIKFLDEAEGTSEYLKREGRPIDAYYGYEAIGIFGSQSEIDSSPVQELAGGTATAPGDVKYADINGDGTVNANDRTYLGEGNVPNIIYGISGGLDYKGFDFSFMFQGAADVQYQLQGQIVWPFFNGGSVPKFWAEDHWTASNTSATYSNMNINENNFPQSAPSSLYIYDASYIRLKNIEIGYSLPESVLSKVGISKVRFYVGGQNLWTKSDVPQLDPEAIQNQGQTYPNVKSVNFGVQVNF